VAGFSDGRRELALASTKGHENSAEALRRPQECSSMARAPVSKTGGWGFESLHSCHFQGVSGPETWVTERT
jgi:hypothetical protein